jgi:hypothetical protein
MMAEDLLLEVLRGKSTAEDLYLCGASFGLGRFFAPIFRIQKMVVKVQPTDDCVV